MTERDLSFIHRLHRPDAPDGTAVVLLHGAGGDETSLLPLGARIAPRALVLSPRGRNVEEGHPRFFRRLGGAVFDQKDIRAEAEAFAVFLAEAEEAYGIVPESTVFIGYSNGANMIAATMLLHPGAVRAAVLLRAMDVLETSPAGADLAGARVLMLSGRSDPVAAQAAGLAARLAAAGAAVEHRLLPAGHDIGVADFEAARDFRLEMAGMAPLGNKYRSRLSES